jgi:hypothetical protein
MDNLSYYMIEYDKTSRGGAEAGVFHGFYTFCAYRR